MREQRLIDALKRIQQFALVQAKFRGSDTVLVMIASEAARELEA